MTEDFVTRMKRILREMKTGTFDTLTAGLDFFTDEFIPALKEDASLVVFLYSWQNALISGIDTAAKISTSLHFCFARRLVLSFPPDDIADVIIAFLETYPSQRIMLQTDIAKTALKDDPDIQELLKAEEANERM